MKDELLAGIEKDITHDLIVHAKMGISFDPEKRAEQGVNSYISYMKSTLDSLIERAKGDNDKLNIIKDMFPKYREGYKNRLITAYERESRCMSTMITGAGNFPVAQQKKRHESYDRALKELYNFDEYMLSKIRSKMNGTEAIKSGDDDAIDKLRKKVDMLQKAQDDMKAINKILRSKNGISEKSDLIKKIGYKYDDIKEGFASYQLTNNNARLKSAKARLKQLEDAKSRDNKITEFDDFTVEENYDDMRIRFSFDGKPSSDIIAIMKKRGFRWSPKNIAWQRQLTNNGIYAAREAIKEIKELK